LAAVAYSLSTELFYWLLPISLPLIVSIPLSWLSGGRSRSALIHSLRLLRTPTEKRARPQLIDQFESTLEFTQPNSEHPLSRLLSDSDLFSLHLNQLPVEDASRSLFHAPSVTAEWKINHAVNVHHLKALLDQDEVMAILHRPSLLLSLSQRFA
jgi:membrane glycosyltransferase